MRQKEKKKKEKKKKEKNTKECKKHILTSQRGAKHPFSGGNIQHLEAAPFLQRGLVLIF